MENWSVTRKHRTRQGCNPATTAVASRRVREDWTTILSRLASFPQSSLSYCSHRSPTTGLDGLLVISHVIFIPTHKSLGFSWIHSQTEDSNSELQFVHCLNIHAQTQDAERMLLTLHILLDYLSFQLKYGLSFGSQPADFRRQCYWTAVSCSLEYNTIWQTRKIILNMFTTDMPEVITSVYCVWKTSE